MTLMTVNNHDEQDKDRDHRSQPRWSAGKKTDAVLRLLRGESLEELSRELKVEAHRLAAWRDDFLAAGKQGLKGQRPDRSPRLSRSARPSSSKASGTPASSTASRSGSWTSCQPSAGTCLLYTSPSPRDRQKSRMPSSA